MRRPEYQTISWRTLLRRMDGPLEEPEETEFRRWLDSDPRHSDYFDRLSRGWNDAAPSPTRLEDVIDEFDRFVERRRRRLRRRRLAAASAVAACVAAVVCLYWLAGSGGGPMPVMDLYPGGQGGVTILADDRAVDVDEIAGGETVTVGGAEILKDGDRIRYDGEARDSVRNTIIVPRGKECEVTLPDGTAVKLNAGSRLDFRFCGEVRSVVLAGEAFFTVRPEAGRPFVVATDLGCARVYGTQFNIKRYGDDSDIRITLVEGSLGFTPGEGGEVMLEPSHRLVYDGQEPPEVEAVRVEADIAWTNAQFLFERTSLHDITRILSKWYDVEFRFADPALARLTFSGRLDRYERLGTLLRLFEQTLDIEFAVVDDNEIEIRRK